MRKKYNLINWILGNLISMFGIALCTKASFGLSMIAAGPYILHVWLRDSLPWFTQGTAEYVYELFILVITCIAIRKFKPSYLLVFAEAVIAGLVLDGWFLLLGGNGMLPELSFRIAAFAAGAAITTLGIAFFFRTTMPLQAYEFFVVKIAETYGYRQEKVKFFFDIGILIFVVLLALLLTHSLTGIGIGTILITLVNAPLISLWGKLVDRIEKPEKGE